jgi:uncharacterized protein (DUF302 family)
MKLKKLSTIVASLLLSVSVATAAGTLADLHGTKGQPDKELGEMVKKLNSIGFDAVGKNEHIETHYYNKYKEKNLDLLNFYPVIDKESIRELLLANPDFGAYAPFNLLAFKKMEKDGGKNTWYGHLDADTMLNIIGAKDEANKKKFKEMVAKLDKLVIDSMKPTEEKRLSFGGDLPAEPLLKMVMEFEQPEDIEEFVEEFVMKHDGLFAKKEFIIAGFLDLKFEYSDLELEFEKYDAYWISSLCHLGFSNSVFNHGDPQAGLFAPCSVYFYIPKGKNELHVGYATVDNWISTTGISDKKKTAYMKEISKSVEKTLGELGFKKEGSVTKSKSEVKTQEKAVEKPKAEAKSEPKVEAKKALPAVAVSTTGSSASNGEIAELKAMLENLTKEVKSIKKILNED